MREYIKLSVTSILLFIVLIFALTSVPKGEAKTIETVNEKSEIEEDSGQVEIVHASHPEELIESEVEELPEEVEVTYDLEWHEKELARIEEEKRLAKERLEAYKANKRAQEESAEPEPQEPPTTKPEEPNRNGGRILRNFISTAYDLSVDSCGKRKGDRGYGITSSGTDLTGLDWESARVIATDPSVIPTGTKVELKFHDENYHKYNGVYRAEDTGGAIKGNKIDLFYKDFNQESAHPEVMQFGRTRVDIKILD